MRIALVQFRPDFPGRATNWDRITRWARERTEEVVVFPELTSCGYSYRSPTEIAGYTDTLAALKPLERIARQHDRLLIGGFAEEEAGGPRYNSAYVISPTSTQIYRKVHLWNYEREIFEPGAAPLLVDFHGHRLGIEICYDLQFPEMASYYSRAGAEAIIAPTAWAREEKGPTDGLQPYTHLAIATAYSHGLFVLVANRTGPERGSDFPGESSVTDPYGRSRHLDGNEGILEADLDFALLEGAKRPTPRNDLDRDARWPIGLPAPLPAPSAAGG